MLWLLDCEQEVRVMHRAGLLTVLGYAAWGEKERIRLNLCSAPVKLSANRNSRSLRYLTEFGAKIGNDRGSALPHLEPE